MDDFLKLTFPKVLDLFEVRLDRGLVWEIIEEKHIRDKTIIEGEDNIEEQIISWLRETLKLANVIRQVKEPNSALYILAEELTKIYELYTREIKRSSCLSPIVSELIRVIIRDILAPLSIEKKVFLPTRGGVFEDIAKGTLECSRLTELTETDRAEFFKKLIKLSWNKSLKELNKFLKEYSCNTEENSEWAILTHKYFIGKWSRILFYYKKTPFITFVIKQPIILYPVVSDGKTQFIPIYRTTDEWVTSRGVDWDSVKNAVGEDGLITSFIEIMHTKEEKIASKSDLPLPKIRRADINVGSISIPFFYIAPDKRSKEKSPFHGINYLLSYVLPTYHSAPLVDIKLKSWGSKIFTPEDKFKSIYNLTMGFIDDLNFVEELNEIE